MWVRGLKHDTTEDMLIREVAPYVGAWIETKMEQRIMQIVASHPMWVRGLKLE